MCRSHTHNHMMLCFHIKQIFIYKWTISSVDFCFKLVWWTVSGLLSSHPEDTCPSEVCLHALSLVAVGSILVIQRTRSKRCSRIIKLWVCKLNETSMCFNIGKWPSWKGENTSEMSQHQAISWQRILLLVKVTLKTLCWKLCPIYYNWSLAHAYHGVQTTSAFIYIYIHTHAYLHMRYPVRFSPWVQWTPISLSVKTPPLLIRIQHTSL